MRVLNSNGFSMVELMVTVAIISLMIAGGYAALSAGEASWFTAEADIQVQENLRKALDQMTTELRESKFSQVTLTNGITDTLKFSIPVICHTGDNLLDANGDVAHWGATTKWGCRDAACMDQNNTCSSVEYKYIQYEVVAGGLLVRKVLSPLNALVMQSTMAYNIVDFQAVMPGASSPLTLTLIAQVTSALRRPVTTTVVTNVDFRNK